MNGETAEPVKHHTQVYSSSQPPFYSFPLLRSYYSRSLPPVKQNPKYANVKSRVVSNYRKQENKVSTSTAKLATIVEE